MTELAIIYLLLGAVAGLLAGLLGVGGGLVIVPVLSWLFVASGVLTQDPVQFAVGTSLATIVFTSLSSIRAHHRRGAVRWDIVRRLLPGIVLGTLAGSLLATRLESATLGQVFGAFEILVAIHMALDRRPSATRELPGTPGMLAAGGGIGAVSALLGIGGGTLTVPFLAWCHVVMREAVATASACGLPIALAGATAFMVLAPADGGVSWNTGYVFWPAVLGIALASITTAPLGARLAHRLPARSLKRVFSLVLLLLGLRMLLG
jgi:uncharacterized membrane protein YfcA